MKKSRKQEIRKVGFGFYSAFKVIIDLSVLLTMVAFMLTFVNVNIEYMRTLPEVLKIAIPLGFIGIMIKIVTINWIPEIK